MPFELVKPLTLHLSYTDICFYILVCEHFFRHLKAEYHLKFREDTLSANFHEDSIQTKAAIFLFVGTVYIWRDQIIYAFCDSWLKH